MSKYVFIDTNVYLSFYHLTSDDLEELKKLSALLDSDEILLALPEQVEDEYWRNREQKISDALKRFDECTLKAQFPTVCKSYERFGKLRELQKEFAKEHAALRETLESDIAANTLVADKVIGELFGKAKRLPRTEELVAAAELRMSIGNPPGKKGSLGDAINWESVLLDCNEGDDLYFVADDRDYYSVLSGASPKEFLLNEWQSQKGSELYFYRQLSAFFRDNYPDISLASEVATDRLVQRFVASESFAETHSVIRGLKSVEALTDNQVFAIAEAVPANQQIRWIIDDTDVRSFLLGFVERNRERIPGSSLAMLEACLRIGPYSDSTASAEEEDDDLPF